MVTLDGCPPELCQRIFQFACTDDGTTECAHSLVSKWSIHPKYIHRSSKPYQLQSISISGADQATGFVLALQRTPEQYRRVAYLTIVNDLTVHALPDSNNDQLTSSPSSSQSSFVRATTKAVEVVIPGVKSYKKYKRLKQDVDHNMLCIQTNRRRDEAVFIASLQILHLTSATLQTLHMNFQSRWKIIPVHFDVGISMPMLRELTVRYHSPFHVEVDESSFLDDEGGGGTPLLPGLRYLDLAGLGIHWHTFGLFKHISKVAPALTHLRLPVEMAGGLESALGLGAGIGVTLDQEGADGDGLAVAEERVAEGADIAANPNASIELGISTPTAISPNQTTSLLPTATLQRVYIQPLSRHFGHWCANGISHKIEAYLSAMDELKAIESRDERVVVLDCKMEDWRMEDIINIRERDWERDWERGWPMCI